MDRLHERFVGHYDEPASWDYSMAGPDRSRPDGGNETAHRVRSLAAKTRRATRHPAFARSGQNDETPSTATNMPWPVPSLVKRVPSEVDTTVHPLNRYVWP